MARLLALDECSVSLRNALLSTLRQGHDEGLLLPQSCASVESGAYKNVVFRLAGDVPNVPVSVFSADLFTGLSAVRLTDADEVNMQRILDEPTKRAEMLSKLTSAIPSELADPNVQIGPELDGDEFERDLEGSEWTAGFDGSSSFIGVFSCQNSHAPDVGAVGRDRVHDELFLVCRAGGGVARDAFHSRLVAALSQAGATLDGVLSEGGVVGAASLRRVASASVRNRHRLLFRAAEILGLNLPSVGDQASRNRFRGVVADIDVSVNTLRQIDDASRSTWQYSAGVDGASSTGLISMSNAADGLLLFLNPGAEKGKISLKSSESWGSIPFSTQRLVAERAMVDRLLSEKCVNSDAEWLKKRFSWRNRVFGEDQTEVFPFCFHGSHETESFSKSFSRELGLVHYNTVRLRPELVSCGGVNSGKLRPLLSALSRT